MSDMHALAENETKRWYSDYDLEKMFTYRAWSEEEVLKYRPLRGMTLTLAKTYNALLPESPYKTRAINALHEAVYLMNTAITLNPPTKE